MHSGSLFSECEDALRALGRSGKVDVRKLGDRMTHRLVSHAFRAIAAMNVRHAHSADRRCARRRKRFDAITEHDNDIRCER